MMSQTLFSVHLRVPLQSYKNQTLMRPVMPRIFADIEKAQACVDQFLPESNPFCLSHLYYLTPDEVEEEDECPDGFTLYQPVSYAVVAALPEQVLADCVKSFGLLPPVHSDEVAIDSVMWGHQRQKRWAEWWDVNASTMTDEQKRIIWNLLANGSPYEVVEVELAD
jgi:hypothetical protein